MPDLQNLTPETKRKMGMAQRAWLAAKEDIIITQGYRSSAEQNALWQIGRDKNGKIIGRTVTNAKGGQSQHNFGKAFDICFLKNKKAYYPPANDPVWEKVGAIGEKCGLIWGGRWTIKKEGIVDKPHFQTT